MRKIITLPINIVVFIIAIPLFICMRSLERSKWIDRKVTNFELKRRKGKRI